MFNVYFVQKFYRCVLISFRKEKVFSDCKKVSDAVCKDLYSLSMIHINVDVFFSLHSFASRKILESLTKTVNEANDSNDNQHYN